MKIEFIKIEDFYSFEIWKSEHQKFYVLTREGLVIESSFNIDQLRKRLQQFG